MTHISEVNYKTIRDAASTTKDALKEQHTAFAAEIAEVSMDDELLRRVSSSLNLSPWLSHVTLEVSVMVKPVTGS